MRKLMITGCLLVVGTVLGADADDASLVSAMKQIGPTCSGLGKKLGAKDASSAADAKQLAGWFDGVHKYWQAKNATDGATMSKTAIAEFEAVSKLAGSGDWDGASASFKKATATCSGCHGAHREKAADGSWKIK